jgi:hypothetical protein
MRLALAVLAGVVLSGSAHAYDQKVHVFLSERGYQGPKAALPDDDASKKAASALREQLWKAGAEAHDPETKRRFLARFATLQSFDPWAYKRFLGLNPDKSIAGLDDTALPAGDPVAVYGLASRLPDDDFRNRDRIRHGDDRKPLHQANGEPMPEDPATLEMGSVTGLSSQAHAHYQLARLTFSDDPQVLKDEPRRFAKPPTVHTFGAEYAELYSALAVLAARLPSGERLALTHAGAAAHHIEDVANQIHTVQVGIYDFFVDAKIESIKEELRSVGGILRSRPAFIAIGIDIIGNHHVLLEALYQKHLLAPGDPVRKLTDDAPADDQFTAALQRIAPGCAPGFGREITAALVERSSLEGGPVYAAIRAVADPRLRKAGVKYKEGDDPDGWIRPGANLSAFYDLEVRGARRSDQALGAWWQRFESCRSAPPETISRMAETIVKERLDALEAAEARAKTWVPEPRKLETVNYWVPAGYAVALVVLALIVRRILRRKKK